MELLIQERKSLHAALASAFPGLGDVETMTRLELGVLLSEMTATTVPLPTVILNVITYFEQKDRIVELIHAAIAANSTNVALSAVGKQILDRIGAEATTTLSARPVDPIDVCFMDPGPQPFISRQTLRQFLRQAVTPNGFPILVVNGLSKTGKSYSFQYISYLKRQTSDFAVAWVDLKDEVYGEYKPEDLARDVAIPLGWDLASLPPRPSTRYAKDLAKWMLGQSNQKIAVAAVVIVLDGFHQPELYGETREFVQEMIKQVAANTSKIRLVLLNYGETLLPPGLPPIATEPLTMLSRPEVTQFFTTFAKQRGQTPDPAAIDDIVKFVVDDIQSNDPEYNEKLNQKVKEAAQLLLA
jgi:hypothetical protein